MKIKITTLSENTATGAFLAEWGLSILVDVDGLKILVDTGRGFSTVYNAQLLGIDLSTVDWLVLSHGHLDHTGGLRDVIRRAGKLEIIAHPDIWQEKYIVPKGQSQEFAGIPFVRQELESDGANFHLTKEPYYITNNILTTGEIPATTSFEKSETNILLKLDGKLLTDPLADDQALVIDSDNGLIVILGCAHRGIINTLCYARKLTGNNSIYAVIGGTHLINASDERINETIAALKSFNVQKLGVSHCTGFHASTLLAQAFGDAFFLNNAGSQLYLP